MPQIAIQDYIRIYCPKGVDSPQEAELAELAKCYDAGTIMDVILYDEKVHARILSASKSDVYYRFTYFCEDDKYYVQYPND